MGQNNNNSEFIKDNLEKLKGIQNKIKRIVTKTEKHLITDEEYTKLAGLLVVTDIVREQLLDILLAKASRGVLEKALELIREEMKK